MQKELIIDEYFQTNDYKCSIRDRIQYLKNISSTEIINRITKL